jgi:soluble lytic murein transglycosylase-like protein
MATTTLAIPSSGLTSPASWGSRAAIKGMLEKIWKNYGTFIKFASTNSKIPSPMLTSFIAVESGGNPTAGGSGSKTQGLMQWNRDYAKSQLEDELAKGRLTPDEKDKLAAFGIKFDKAGKTRVITQADQIKPELNILIGSIVLGQLVDTTWGTQDGVIRLDRVISVYNAGPYGDTGKKARLGNHASPLALANVVNTTTSSYIKKIMGKDGALDIATSDLKDTIK